MKTKTLFNWHLWLGLVTGVFMFIIGGSGAVAVFIEEIDWLVTPALRASAKPGQPRAGIDRIVSTVRTTYPGDRLTTLNLSERPSFAHVAKVQSKERGNLDVFIDPVTGKINGDREYSGAYTSTLRNFIRQLHLRLFMGLWGRVFVGVFGVTLVLSCITGLWIYRGWIKNLFRFRWNSAGARVRWSDLHKLVGVWSLAFNILIGVTGAVFGFENLTNQIRSKWLRPASTAEAAAQNPRAREPRPAAPTTPPLPLETILAKAHAAFPELTVRSISFPNQANGPIALQGDVPSALVQQSHVRRANSITLDPYTGEVRRQVDGRDARGWSRLYSSFDPLHFGYFGGIPTKVIWFVLGLSPSVLALSGTWLWWRRTRAHRTPPKKLPASTPSPHVKSITWIVAGLTLIGAYVLVSRAQGSWALSGKTIEFGLAKPVALALVAFPVSGFLLWLALRSQAHRLKFAATATLCSAWYLLLVSLFQ
ncbi:PepSY-associated TM helix domain-containing protein [Oleiharenicola lentus]|uniref:PepSY-associated TM helix domain-containing protein n=1 Tax=Oleiharenicola lentus TaxID=2508720 RepID=UPI003F6792C0